MKKVGTLCLVVLVGGSNWLLAEQKKYQIPDVVVDANLTNSGFVTKSDKFQGVKTISKEMINLMPSGNGDFASLLRVNPNVQFGNQNRQSTTLGEIDVADVSINGSRPWQNNYTLDGVNINNDINPAAFRYFSKTGDLGILVIHDAASQGLAIDSDFIESINVHDSDVSSKFGGFSGGVIEAKTRNPRLGFHGKFSLQHTQYSWSKLHVVDEDRLYNSTTAEYQPKFSKWITRLNLEGYLRDDLGILFGYSNTKSTIPLKFTPNGPEEKQRRDIKNYFLKSLWHVNDRLTITPSVTYAPQSNKYFEPYVKDSTVYMKSGGLNLNLNANYDADFAIIDQTIGYNILESSRYADKDYRKNWINQGNKNWGFGIRSTEGGFGDIKQVQKSFSYNLDFEFEELNALGASHKFQTGFEFKNQSAIYEYPNGFYHLGSPRSLGGAVCPKHFEDKGYCLNDDGAGGQYFRELDILRAGKTSASMKSWAFYLEDEMSIGNLSVRPGLRFAGDDYMKKRTLAPRFSLGYDIFGDKTSFFSFGLNRYYARNLFYYKLSHGKDLLRDTSRFRRDPNADFTWRPRTNSRLFSELKIPYDDELSLGFKQQFAGLELGLKYVKRTGRDQIQVRSNDNIGLPDGTGSLARWYGVYTNGGRSKSDVFTLTFKNLEDFKIFNTYNGFEIGFDKTRSQKEGRDYYDMFSYDKFDTYVQLDGKIIKFREMPVDDYARPWTFRFNTITKIPSYNLTFNNFFILKGSQNKIVDTGKVVMHQRERISVFETVNLGKSFSWDARIGYEHKFPKNISAFINLDIFNILNKKNKATVADTLIYEPGRQFWLEVGIKW
ncbi:TonB-dependent receptor plug domain-containing protein [Campylobacter sp.]|uniref:TonB-dependent receptor plug domain-containing protein n=1 Tax=Campylobacter sp. TaxID=205 RepID=UPI002704DE39|nr:TonB-dependent receptor plug domain-containing protein [Campylobacter sp.]